MESASVVLIMVSAQVLRITIFMVIIAMAIINSGDAAYKRPPFNGSMFGKRSGIGKHSFYPQIIKYIYRLILEYSSEKSLEAMCEIALDACQMIFSQEVMK